MTTDAKPTIWKHAVKVADQHISVPNSSKIIHFGEQDGELFVWSLAYPSGAAEQRRIIVVGTGWDAPPEHAARHIGTVIARSGHVWHAFEGIAP